jgi:hypothetical protein
MLKFIPGGIYHIQNAGCGQQRVFYTERNYRYFVEKIKRHVSPYAELLMYKLKEHAIHLIIQVKHHTLFIASKNRDRTLAQSIGIALRSYAQAINKQENRKGVLWQGPTEAELIGFHEQEEEETESSPSIEETYKIDEEHYDLYVPKHSAKAKQQKSPSFLQKFIRLLNFQFRKRIQLFWWILILFNLLFLWNIFSKTVS